MHVHLSRSTGSIVSCSWHDKRKSWYRTVYRYKHSTVVDPSMSKKKVMGVSRQLLLTLIALIAHFHYFWWDMLKIIRLVIASTSAMCQILHEWLCNNWLVAWEKHSYNEFMPSAFLILIPHKSELIEHKLIVHWRQNCKISHYIRGRDRFLAMAILSEK